MCDEENESAITKGAEHQFVTFYSSSRALCANSRVKLPRTRRSPARDSLWSWKLAYSLLHFLQRLSSPRFHARQLKSLINMQTNRGRKNVQRGRCGWSDAKRRKKGCTEKRTMNADRWKKVVLDRLQELLGSHRTLTTFFRFLLIDYIFNNVPRVNVYLIFNQCLWFN